MNKFEVRWAVRGWIVSYIKDYKLVEEVYEEQENLEARLPELVAEMECE